MISASSLFPIFSPFPQLLTAFSTKEDKQMRLQVEQGEDTETLKNREKFFEKLSISKEQVINAKLVQKSTVAVVDKSAMGSVIKETDGLITNEKDVFLSIIVADCLPVFLYDHKKEAVGLLHAGWRGLYAKIIPKGIAAMQENFGSLAEDIVVGIGPGIGVCHYSVQEDILRKFAEYKNVAEERDNQVFLNLKQIAKQQLLSMGVKEAHIEISPLCTYCEKDMFYSHRRDQVVPLEAMLAIIGISTTREKIDTVTSPKL